MVSRLSINQLSFLIRIPSVRVSLKTCYLILKPVFKTQSKHKRAERVYNFPWHRYSKTEDPKAIWLFFSPSVIFFTKHAILHKSDISATPSLELDLTGTQNWGQYASFRQLGLAHKLWAQREAQHFEKSDRPSVALYICSFTLVISLEH